MFGLVLSVYLFYDYLGITKDFEVFYFHSPSGF